MLLLLDGLLHKVFVLIKIPMVFLFNKYNEKQSLYDYPELDIVIPIIEKDIIVAKECVKAARAYSLNPIGKIFVVAPINKLIQDFCIQQDLVFVNEIDILPLPLEHLKSLVQDKSKIGWLLQQLLKLNSDQIKGINENYLILDSDTVMLKKQWFKSKDKTILKFSDEFHFLYRLTNQKLLHAINWYPASFICHHMVFNQVILKNLRNEIELKNGDKWPYVILKSAANFHYFFSEYELYAQYLLRNHHKEITIQYWFNRNGFFKKQQLNKIETLNRFQSTSYHNYDRPLN